MTDLTPRDRREEVALFRAEVIGGLTRQDLHRGELRAALRALSQTPLRPPGAAVTRCYSVTTLERWYYAYKRDGLEGLKPKGRADRGCARALTPEQRELVLDIRRQHPRASAELILETLVAEGRIDADAISAQTLRRLFREHGLDAASCAAAAESHARLRWEAERPGALWQADVCHGPTLRAGERTVPVRVHAILDDSSRYVVALEAHSTEREADMLAIVADAIRRHGPPDALYLDNGATYSGKALALACERLGITLIHSKPYTPQGRGKIERFFRTLRGKCLDWTGNLDSLHAVNVRLAAFLDQHYHSAPHAGLLGRSPADVWQDGRAGLRALEPDKLRDAFTERSRRRVRRDSTLDIDGKTYELAQGFLAGKVVTVHRTLIDPRDAWVEFDGRRFDLVPVDVKRNARRRRTPRPQPATVPFDPASTRLDEALSRTSRPEETT